MLKSFVTSSLAPGVCLSIPHCGAAPAAASAAESALGAAAASATAVARCGRNTRESRDTAAASVAHAAPCAAAVAVRRAAAVAPLPRASATADCPAPREVAISADEMATSAGEMTISARRTPSCSAEVRSSRCAPEASSRGVYIPRVAATWSNEATLCAASAASKRAAAAPTAAATAVLLPALASARRARLLRRAALPPAFLSSLSPSGVEDAAVEAAYACSDASRVASRGVSTHLRKSNVALAGATAAAAPPDTPSVAAPPALLEGGRCKPKRCRRWRSVWATSNCIERAAPKHATSQGCNECTSAADIATDGEDEEDHEYMVVAAVATRVDSMVWHACGDPLASALPQLAVRAERPSARPLAPATTASMVAAARAFARAVSSTARSANATSAGTA